jgi:hypothetical protein
MIRSLQNGTFTGSRYEAVISILTTNFIYLIHFMVKTRAGDDCADMTCYNPGSPKLPVIHRYDCAGTKLNPLTGRVIRKVPVPLCK